MSDMCMDNHMKSYSSFSDKKVSPKASFLKDGEYAFLKTNPLLGDNICLLTFGGSKAYGTDLPTSDTDVRGVALNPSKQMFNLEPDFEQVVETNTDTTIYSLNKIVKLLLSCNPNTIEMFGCRDEDYLYVNDIGRLLLSNCENFLSVRAIDSFGGYARSQFNRLEHGLLGNGQNDDKKLAMMRHSMECVINAFNIKHKKDTIDLSLSLETRKIELPGLTLDNTIEEELLVISGSFDKYPVNEFKTIISELHKVYSEYGNINKRNTKKTDIKLAKHMMHLIRLYLMGTKLNTEGVIQTYWGGKEHDLLMDIRNGKYMYSDGMRVRPEFYEMLHDIQATYEKSVLETVLKEEPNYDALNEMLLSVYRMILTKK